ncbi:RNA annealing protein Yra1 [Rasamsonia emersonii CBS 393.64]|uniref:RNA annealing protein Yra1 n=1 Tax=Rasamsonia emersonii (strain ATCC 16479 / CBS 393.64 / IMI 116815) TaxID=1408163 RepID=A0A0F4Z5A4_RASE3|nr:RNA annealing protein Yra1 [Rasamsonia emersonii CBS 393.64]KKA25677.1 RNA annealing protein Yra1 [Rasamsonia emersonii CBS 393.64]
MSSKLDQSLDEIAKSRRQSGRSARRRGGAGKVTKAPVGGVKKNTKAARGAGKGATISQTAPPTESKIIVSGLPPDVNEANIKHKTGGSFVSLLLRPVPEGLEYFTKSAGPVKKVMLTYNQNGTSRGIASITFSKPDTAAKAAKELNGLLVDGRPMKIEVVVDATHAPEVPAPKPLTERVTQAKAQPKPATGAKPGRRGRGRPRRRNAANRKKTVEELDAEMVDYFAANNENAATTDGNAATNGTAQQPATNGEDLEISYSVKFMHVLIEPDRLSVIDG